MYRFLVTQVTLLHENVPETSVFEKSLFKNALEWLKSVEHDSSPPIDQIPAEILMLGLNSHLMDLYADEAEQKKAKDTIINAFQVLANYHSHIANHVDEIRASQ